MIDQNKDKESRKEQLKSLIIGLHDGDDIEELKLRFKDIIGDISSSEIGEIEQELIDEGALRPEEITELCDLHVEIFKESLDEKKKSETIPGHPIHTYMLENKRASELIQEIRNAPPEDKLKKVEELSKIDTHYTRIENQLFPLLENLGISGPSQVMWAVHDNIRIKLKTVDLSSVKKLLKKVEDLIYKEEKILFPMALEKFTETDWLRVREGEEEIGYAWVIPGDEWKAITAVDVHSKGEIPNPGEFLNLDTGKLTLEQINLILKHLPVDISFVNASDEVKYYSATDDRIFPRSPAVIGRKVQKCHPSKSLNKVEEIVNKFKKGEEKSAEFWINLGERMIYIRYFAVRDNDGKYIGTLEVSQDITQIKKLEGERRLAQWN